MCQINAIQWYIMIDIYLLFLPESQYIELWE